MVEAGKAGIALGMQGPEQLLLHPDYLGQIKLWHLFTFSMKVFFQSVCGMFYCKLLRTTSKQFQRIFI